MTTRIPAQCLSCKHWISPLDRSDPDVREHEPTQMCAAFPLPSGIPAAIWWNKADHRQPFKGDHGIRWESDGSEFPELATSRR